MKKYVFKNSIVNLVLGVLLIAFAIVAMEPITGLIRDILDYAIAFLIIVYSVLHFVKHQKSYSKSKAFFILTAELVIAILLAVLLLPFIAQVTATFAVGLVLYVHGFAYLLTLQLLNKRSSFIIFLVYMFVLTLGAYIFFGNPNLAVIEWILLGIIAIYGVILVVLGIEGLKNKPSK